MRTRAWWAAANATPSARAPHRLGGHRGHLQRFKSENEIQSCGGHLCRRPLLLGAPARPSRSRRDPQRGRHSCPCTRARRCGAMQKGAGRGGMGAPGRHPGMHGSSPSRRGRWRQRSGAASQHHSGTSLGKPNRVSSCLTASMASGFSQVLGIFISLPLATALMFLRMILPDLVLGR